MKKKKILSVFLAALLLLTGCADLEGANNGETEVRKRSSKRSSSTVIEENPKDKDNSHSSGRPDSSDNSNSNSSGGYNDDKPGSSDPWSSGIPTLPDINFYSESARNLDFKLTYAAGTTIRIAAGYNSTSTGITFDDNTIYAKGRDGSLQLPDGKFYSADMLKPTWQAVSDILDIRFNDKYTGKSASDEWGTWNGRLSEVDIVSGTAGDLNDAGVAGKLVDLSKYLDDMPNFKAYLDNNPIVRLSITSYSADGRLGSIYFAPYFDGVNDVERVPLMRTDWVEKLLNGSGEFSAASCNITASPVYRPYMPTSGTVTVEVVKNGTTDITERLTKNYDAEGGGNIIAQMNAKGSMTGVEAVNMLRKYIDVTYNGYYGENRADLFIGQNAAWDADELVALLRCVVANPQTLNGRDSIQGIFSRDNNNQRRVDLYRLGAILFGARGLESRQDFLYVGNDMKMHDARQEAATYEMLEKMNQMVQEGLISSSFINKEDVKSDQMVKDDIGFMSYDYNQTQTVFNEQWGMDYGEKYRAVMIPVAKWYDDGTTTPKYFRFTESWRSVKDSGWAIPASTESNTDVLNACLHLFDYAFSLDGQILMSYGPDAFIDVKDASVRMSSASDISKKYNTFNFNGEQMPKISNATYDALWDLEGGNFTNFARKYLGSTLHFVKSQAFEVQCTTEAGREGAQIIANAIGAGIIYHPVLSTAVSNPWYISVPTILPITKYESNEIANMKELVSLGYFSTGRNDTNIFCEMIVNGYYAANAPGASAKACADKVANDWSGRAYLQIKNDDWNDILNF